MEFVFLISLIGVVFYLANENKTGSLLCLLTLFPEIIGIILEHSRISGMAMALRYSIYILIILKEIKFVNVRYNNIWKHPLSVLFYILIGVLILHNQYIVGGAINNKEIASFQLNIILRVLIPYIILMAIGNRRRVLYDYYRSIPWWGLSFIIVFIFLIGISNVDFGDRMTIEKETGINSIALSRLGAITFLASLMGYLWAKKSSTKIKHLIILICSVFILLLASQRGTIIGVAVAVLMALGIVLIRQGKIIPFIGSIILISGLITLLIFNNNFEIMGRFQQLENYREFERFADYGIAWKSFVENNYITGLGSMGYSVYTGGQRPYPHSLILELMSEYGIIGLLYAVLVIILGGIISFRILIKSTKISPIMSVPLIWIALLFSVLVSGNLLYNAPFIFITGILILIYQKLRIYR